MPDLAAAGGLSALGLTCLYLDHNPCAKEPAYANHLRDIIPTLEQLDANYLPARGG